MLPAGAAAVEGDILLMLPLEDGVAGLMRGVPTVGADDGVSKVGTDKAGDNALPTAGVVCLRRPCGVLNVMLVSATILNDSSDVSVLVEDDKQAGTIVKLFGAVHLSDNLSEQDNNPPSLLSKSECW